MSTLGKALVKLSSSHVKIEELAKDQKENKVSSFKPLSTLEDVEKKAMFSELSEMNMLPEKVAESGHTSREDAEAALKRLRRLERSEPTADQLMRGAAVGAVAGPAIGMTSRLIEGGLKGKGLLGTGRAVAGQATSGALLSGVVPYVRYKLDLEAEKEKIRDYLGTSSKGKLRGQIKKRTGL